MRDGIPQRLEKQTVESCGNDEQARRKCEWKEITIGMVELANA